jgi:hypothetical protein
MYNLLIKDPVNKEDLLTTLQSYLGQAVSVAWFNIADHSSADVLLECAPMRGDFCINVNLYTNLEIPIFELAMFYCRKLNTQILISDEDDNPFTWILINESGIEGIVNQVPAENNEFVIKR